MQSHARQMPDPLCVFPPVYAMQDIVAQCVTKQAQTRVSDSNY